MHVSLQILKPIDCFALGTSANNKIYYAVQPIIVKGDMQNLLTLAAIVAFHEHAKYLVKIFSSVNMTL